MKYIFNLFFVVMVMGISTGAFCANNDVPDMSDLLEGLEDELVKDTAVHDLTTAMLEQRAVQEEVAADQQKKKLLNQRLFQAVSVNNVKAMDKWIKAGAEVTACDERGFTLLHEAALHESVDALNYLLPLIGGLLDTQDRKGNTPLHFGYNKAPILQALIGAGAAVDRENFERRTPLLFAVWAGNNSAVKALLQAGAGVDLNTVFEDTPYRWSPLYLAIVRENPDTIRTLLEAGADPDMTRPTIMTAQNFNDILGISYPLKKGVDPQKMIKINLTPRQLAKSHHIEHLLPAPIGRFTKPVVAKQGK